MNERKELLQERMMRIQAQGQILQAQYEITKKELDEIEAKENEEKEG